jgi:hypothetical protein
MTQTSVTRLNGRLDKLVSSLPGSGYALNVALVYEDALTWKWAKNIFDRAEKLAGSNVVRGTWWKLGDLSHPGVLAGAVSQAMRADLVVVAHTATEGLPLSFYVWVNSWLPHHLPGGSALVALLGAVERPNAESGRVREYLRAVARQGRMHFLLAEQSPADS